MTPEIRGSHEIISTCARRKIALHNELCNLTISQFWEKYFLSFLMRNKSDLITSGLSATKCDAYCVFSLSVYIHSIYFTCIPFGTYFFGLLWFMVGGYILYTYIHPCALNWYCVRHYINVFAFYSYKRQRREGFLISLKLIVNSVTAHLLQWVLILPKKDLEYF